MNDVGGVILVFCGLCIAGFVLGIIALTKNQDAHDGGTIYTFASPNQNGEKWTLGSGVPLTVGKFIVPTNGRLHDFTIRGNAFSSDDDEAGQFYTWTATLLSASGGAGNNQFQITGDGINRVEYQPAGYSTSTTFVMQSGSLKTYSGYFVNTNQLQVIQGQEFEVVVKVDYQVTTLDFADFIVSITFKGP